MVQYANIKASDISRYGRMDAGFHIARTRVAALTAYLEEQHTDQQAIALMEGLDLDALQPLRPLLRGTQRITTETAAKAMRDYPHIALALVQERIHEAIAAKQDEISRHKAGMHRLKALLPKNDAS